MQLRSEKNWGVDWAGLGWLFLFFWYFSCAPQLLIQITGTSGFTGFRQAFLLSALWLVPVLLFPAKTRAIAGVIGAVLWLGSLVSLGYFFIYGQEFSQSVIFIMFESNMAESSEYLTQYFAWWMIAGFALHTVLAYLLWRRVGPLQMTGGPAYAMAAGVLVWWYGLAALSVREVTTSRLW